MTQAACKDFKKRCFDTGRVNQPGFAVYIKLGLSNTTMRESVLYYPHIEIPDANWLKSALLLWDDVYRIVPQSYNPDDTPETKAAVDAGLVRPIRLERTDLLGISKEFKKFLKNVPFMPAGLEAGATSLLHPEKVDATLYPLLEQYAIGEKNGGWIELPKEIVRGYMFFLSTQVARRRKLERATDDKYAFAVSGYFSERANFGDALYDRESPGFYSSLIFDDLLPSHINQIPIKDVIRVAGQTRDERTLFRQELMKFSQGLCECESEEHAKTVINDYKCDLVKAMQALKAAHGFLGKEQKGSLFTMGVPVALTAFGGLISGGANPFGIHTLSSSLLIGAIAAYADFKKAKAAADNPYGAAYLVSLEKQFAGTGTFPAFDRYLEEFVND